VLGLAPGGRQDDYDVSGLDFHRRGRAFDRQLEELHRLWRGEGGVGPPPAQQPRPALLVGGSREAAFRRAAQYADGWTMGGGTPEMFSEALGHLREAWRSAGREGEPRTMALFYFVLGDGAEDAARRSLGDYYAYLGEYADRVVESCAKDEDTVRQYLSGFEAAGVDEVICDPASADPTQVELLAAAIAR
jgi:alkanesulfonate monooxygenase SsuD/methylene tetrahydromethanopterin reductase-like flavin-dependent oxidoreductase (luciferase family)